MASTSKQREAPLVVSGRGPVQLRLVSAGPSTAFVEIGINYGQAEPPHINYSADYCDVLQGRTGVTLIFGKLKPGPTPELRTKIEITFSEEHFVRHLWGSSREMEKTVAAQVRGMELSELAPVAEADKVQCLQSNNVFMAVLGSEVVMDFYYISPGDIHLVRSKQKAEIALDPVVRVVTTAPLLMEFFTKCRPFAEKLSPKFSDEEK